MRETIIGFVSIELKAILSFMYIYFLALINFIELAFKHYFFSNNNEMSLKTFVKNWVY